MAALWQGPGGKQTGPGSSGTVPATEHTGPGSEIGIAARRSVRGMPRPPPSPAPEKSYT